MQYKPVDLERLHVTSLGDRPSKVHSDDRGKTVGVQASFRTWFDALPNLLAGEGLRELVHRTARAIELRRPVLLGMGGHVIKVGLGGMLCDLIRDGLVSAVDRLVTFVNAIKSLPPPDQPAPQVWGLSLWSDLPILGATIREQWSIGPSMQHYNLWPKAMLTTN